MKHHISSNSALLTVSAVLTALPLCLGLGGIERLCPSCGASNCEIDEKWPTPSNLAWSVRVQGSGNVSIASAWSSCPAPFTQTRGYASILSGMTTWNDLFYKLNTSDPAPRADEPFSNFVPGVTSTNEISTFSLSTAPSSTTTSTFAGCTSPNVVTLLQDTNWWMNNGGDAALARTDVCFNGSSITGADIAVNASNNAWGLVEWETPTALPTSNDPDQRVFSTSNAPSMGFADIRGVLAHEVGHFGGMGHTLVDSTANHLGSRFPTMFFQAQERLFAATIVQCSGSTVAVTGARIFGLSARDLEVDDIAGMARGYPSPQFASDTASISGKVDLTSGNERNISIVAIAKDNPAGVRVGSLTQGVLPSPENAYFLTGLPRLRYYLYAEAVDRPQDQSPNFNWSDPSRYFPDGFALPNYSFVELAGCPLAQTFFAPFFYYCQDTNGDQICECSPSVKRAQAAELDLTSGSLVNRNFVCAPVGPTLSVQRSSLSPSTRGARVAPGETVTLTVTGGSTPRTLFISPVLENVTVGSQLRQVKVYTNKPYPTQWPHKVELGTGNSFSWVVPQDQALKNFFVQAQCGLGVPDFSNVVNFWISQ